MLNNDKTNTDGISSENRYINLLEPGNYDELDSNQEGGHYNFR